MSSKIWGFCHTLRHDGIDYGDYIEQITYLLFLKMADEKALDLPERTDWAHLRKESGTELLEDYQDALRVLGKEPGILGDIFSGAQSRFTNPVNLKKLFGLIDETEWTSLDVDVKGAVFEGLLEKAAAEGKKGAGQYFTPRVLIRSMVRCMKPDPRASKDFKIGDPACGTGGFLVAAYEWLLGETGGALDRDIARRVRRETFFGQDLVARPRRLALMNLHLHQVEPHISLGDSIYETPGPTRFDVVLTNPPFGTKGANQAPDRDDFVIQTSNKQLNFVQHVLTVLKPGGRAAIVVPDNVLFAQQYQYEGRSHSLWFCDAQVEGDYAWHETAFMVMALIPKRGRQDPFALDPGKESAKALWAGMAEIQMAWPFTRLGVDDLGEFVDRWAGWFADAAAGKLAHPSSMPERDPAGSWRRS